MYIPSHQYVVKQIGGEHSYLQYTDGTSFTGTSVVELSNGTMYDVPPNDLARGIFDNAKKIKLDENRVRSNPKLSLNFLKRFLPKRPTDKAKITRYFMKNKVNSKIVEIDRETFDKFNDGEPSHIAFAELPWYIAGPLYDVTANNMTMEGTVSKNQKELDFLEKTFPGIKSYARDLTFLSDPQYVNQEPQEITRPSTILPSPS